MKKSWERPQREESFHDQTGGRQVTTRWANYKQSSFTVRGNTNWTAGGLRQQHRATMRDKVSDSWSHVSLKNLSIPKHPELKCSFRFLQVLWRLDNLVRLCLRVKTRVSAGYSSACLHFSSKKKNFFKYVCVTATTRYHFVRMILANLCLTNAMILHR